MRVNCHGAEARLNIFLSAFLPNAFGLPAPIPASVLIALVWALENASVLSPAVPSV